jgi:hypothetical protein
MVWLPAWISMVRQRRGGADESSDGPASAVFDPAADREGGEHDGQMRVDRVALVVVDRSGLQVVI